MNLYDVAMEYAQLEELITELDGQSGETVDESLHAAFRHAEGSLKDKVDGVLKLIRNAETDSDRFAEESNRFRKRSQVARNKAGRFRRLLKLVMRTNGMAKIETDNFTVSHFDSAKCRVDYDITRMPDRFLKQVWVIDPDQKDEARAEALATEPEWATIDHGTTLRIS
jgi:hypothetical protein